MKYTKLMLLTYLSLAGALASESFEDPSESTKRILLEMLNKQYHLNVDERIHDIKVRDDFLDIDQMFNSLGPGHTGGGNGSLVIFSNLVDELVTILQDPPAVFAPVIPPAFDAQKLEQRIHIVPGHNLMLAEVPVVVLNYPELHALRIDVRRWDKILASKEPAQAVALVYHELLQLLGNLDDDQQYTYSSKLYKLLQQEHHLIHHFSFALGLRDRQHGQTIQRDLFIDIEESLSRYYRDQHGLNFTAFVVNGEVAKSHSIPKRGRYKYSIAADFHLFVTSEHGQLLEGPFKQLGCVFTLEQQVLFTDFGLQTQGTVVDSVDCRQGLY